MLGVVYQIAEWWWVGAGGDGGSGERRQAERDRDCDHGSASHSCPLWVRTRLAWPLSAHTPTAMADHEDIPYVVCLRVRDGIGH